jgi:hypothetical protein
LGGIGSTHLAAPGARLARAARSVDADRWLLAAPKRIDDLLEVSSEPTLAQRRRAGDDDPTGRQGRLLGVLPLGAPAGAEWPLCSAL